MRKLSFVSWLKPAVRLFVFVLSTSLLLLVAGCNCSDGDVSVDLQGCDDCPDRCIRVKDGIGKCVACIKDEHCTSLTAPTRRCNAQNKCVCGTDRDCGNGVCQQGRGCVECKENKHCKSPDRPFCVGFFCTECNPGAIRGCAPTDIQVCVKGTQTCKANGLWDTCKNWQACSSCTKKPECQLGQKQCTSNKDEKPGRYYQCVRDKDGCLVWDDKEKNCKADQTCSNGECEPKTCPPRECNLGETRCSSDSAMQTCGRNKDDCIVWQDPVACKSGEKCSSTSKKCGPDCTPKKEVCNGKDDDCDGQTDEDFADLGKACTVGKGACKNTGKNICSNDGSKVVCDVNAGAPSQEICNGKDDDCDGQVDNGNLCPNGKPCVNGLCGKPEPGCADGTRELFTDMQKFPLVAGCKGWYRGENLRNARTNQSCGNNQNNACKAAEDLCAKGWHICMRNGKPSDLSARVSANDCATNGAGLFVAASSHCKTSKPVCSYNNGVLPCTQGGPCSEPVCCGTGCKAGLCTGGVWLKKTLCARPQSYIGCGNANSFHGNPIITGVLCCKDTP